MNSKQRVHAALRREPTDRVPVWMWFHPETARGLARALEIPAGRLPDVLGDDIRQTWVGNNQAMEGIVHDHEGERHRDPWGIEWVKAGPFNQICASPLEDADADAIERYAFPVESVAALMRPMESVAAAAGDFFLGCDVSPCLFELACRLRGGERAIMDLALEPDRTARFYARAGDFAVLLAEAACERFPLDWLWTGDDVGGQQAMVMSPACWRERIKPHLARIMAVGKRRKLWVAYHSCGSIRPIIPDLIEIGLDVLNPIQGNCPGMDPFELKNEFGERLAIMGGLDTQELLPKGTANEVHRQARRLVEELGSGGGYILAASHTVPPETPVENIFAVYRAAGISREQIFDRAAVVRKGP